MAVADRVRGADPTILEDQRLGRAYGNTAYTGQIYDIAEAEVRGEGPVQGRQDREAREVRTQVAVRGFPGHDRVVGRAHVGD